MIYIVLYSYLFGWVVTSIGLALIVRKLQDPVRPPSHPIPLVIAAGAAWPLVVVGVVQMAIIVLVVHVAQSWSVQRGLNKQPSKGSTKSTVAHPPRGVA